MTQSRARSAERKTSAAWPPFEEKLARVLSEIEEDQFLIISVKRSNRYVQFCGQGSFGLRAEAASNHYLVESEKLSRSQLLAMTRIGWHKPTGSPKKATPERDPDGSPNFFVDFPAPVAAKDVARLAVETLVGVLHVPHPGRLQYEAFAACGEPLALPQLGLRRATRAKGEEVGANLQQIARKALETLRAVTGLDDLEFDKDGDIAIRYGEVVVFIHVAGEQPFVRFLSPLMFDVPKCSTALLRRLNQLNSESTGVRYCWLKGAVHAVAELPAEPWVDAHAAQVFQRFCRVAEHAASLLRGEFGGTASRSDAPPSETQH